MTKRLGLVAFVGSVFLITAAYGSAFLPGDPPVWAAWALALGSCGSMVSMMVVGASRHGRVGRRLGAALGVVLAITAGGFVLLLALPPTDPGDPTLVLGLPPRAAVLLYGIGLLPILVVPIAYAATFDDFTLTEADLARVRAAGKARAAAASSGLSGSSGSGRPSGAATRTGPVAELGS